MKTTREAADMSHVISGKKLSHINFVSTNELSLAKMSPSGRDENLFFFFKYKC